MSLREALDLQALETALERVQQSDAPGLDGQRPSQLHRRELCELLGELRSGGYRPRPLLRYDQPKASGGLRRIGIPAARDRTLQVAVLHQARLHLDALLSPQVHGGRPGCGPRSALEHLGGQVGLRRRIVLVKADIQNLFDSIPQEPLLQVLAAWPDPLWLSLCRSWMEAWPTSPGRGVPQGAPLSSLQADLYLARHLDGALSRSLEAAPAMSGVERLLQLLGAEQRSPLHVEAGLLGWIRYVDDIALATAEPGGAIALLRELQARARRAGLELSPPKVFLADSAALPRAPFPLLGEALHFVLASGFVRLRFGPGRP